jgi:O-antigen ligase
VRNIVVGNLRKFLKWPLLALAFTPLVISPSTLFPYIFGKAVFIRLATTIFCLLLAFYIMGSGRRALADINWARLKNPIFLLWLSFTILAALSASLAVDGQVAIWGDAERGEGFLLLFHLLLFLGGSMLVFEKQDWLLFFKLSLFAGSIIAFDSLVGFLSDPSIRPVGYFIGNPAFTSVYALFVIFAAMVVTVTERKSQFWGATSALAILLAIIALLVTKTRGVFVGILAAFLVVAIYWIVSGKNKKIVVVGRPVLAKRVGQCALGTIFILMLIFVNTKSHPIWQVVPGLDRLAQISASDATTQTRLINLRVSLRAVDPRSVGVERALLGWGPENFYYAYNQFYDPTIGKYETTWFDRAHNKLMDVLVMHGILGLLTYLALWFYVFRLILRRRRDGSTSEQTIAPLIFFGVSYFVQNLFLFDQITTYIPLFVFLGYVAQNNSPQPTPSSSSTIGDKRFPSWLSTTASATSDLISRWLASRRPLRPPVMPPPLPATRVCSQSSLT